MENIFKYSKIFEGLAANNGQVLGTVPDNSKFIEILGINYTNDTSFYYFAPIILRTEFMKNNDVLITIGADSDSRTIILSFRNNVITITYSSMGSSSTADNNFIAKILSINS